MWFSQRAIIFTLILKRKENTIFGVASHFQSCPLGVDTKPQPYYPRIWISLNNGMADRRL